MLERLFHLQDNNTRVSTELVAGLITFLTMAYIIFVNPAILSGVMFGQDTGMSFDAVTAATCIAAAVATLVMGLYANYPIAQAPGMGENFFFALTVIPAAAAAGFADPWKVALGVVFVSGILFLLLSLAGVRRAIVDAVSPSLKSGMSVGIGLFIAFIGLRNAGVILADPGTAVKLNTHFTSPDLIVFAVGLCGTAILHARRVKGSILWGIFLATLTALALKLLMPHLPSGWSSSQVVQGSMLVSRFEPAKGVFSAPASPGPTAFKMNLKAALSLAMVPYILIFLFMDVFDTIGTLIGVSQQAGLLKGNELPRAQRALLSDAVGTVVGACLGTSTVTSYIESAAGVEHGGRTGLTAVTAAGLFVLALFFLPVIHMVASYPPITAPALVVVGSMMARNVARIAWDDYTEAIPSFLVMIGIPLTYSIADGIALGFISQPVIKLFSGRGRDLNWVMYAIGLILLAYFVFLRATI
ncbi:MAG: NCS2 family permease [Verrucomicrobia bacterium]|nr:MAG: NCS2 family permease [Verrucomicrobiota bacterium]